jgi:hypothetical protein
MIPKNTTAFSSLHVQANDNTNDVQQFNKGYAESLARVPYSVPRSRVSATLSSPSENMKYQNEEATRQQGSLFFQGRIVPTEL